MGHQQRVKPLICVVASSGQSESLLISSLRHNGLKTLQHEAVNAEVKCCEHEAGVSPVNDFTDEWIHWSFPPSLHSNYDYGLTLDFSLFHPRAFTMPASLLMYVHADVYDFIPALFKIYSNKENNKLGCICSLPSAHLPIYLFIHLLPY